MRMKKIVALLLSALMLCTMFATVVEAKTTTQSIYVVSGIKIKEGSTTSNASINYNSNGFITKMTFPYKGEKIVYTYSYDSNNQMKKAVENVLTGPDKGKTNFTYEWKNGLLTKMKDVDSEGYSGITTYKYNSKNKLVSSQNAEEISTYKYKNGRISQVTSEYVTEKLTYTDDGYIKNDNIYFNGAKFGYINNKFKYDDNGRVKSLTLRYNYATMKTEKTVVYTYSYKKISVNKSDVKAIKEQQRDLIMQNISGYDMFVY